MVDNVRYFNEEETLMLVEPEGWHVPLPSNTWHQGKINQWLDGRTDEWDVQKEVYDKYALIMGHDASIAQYLIDAASCNTDRNICIVNAESANNNCEGEYFECLMLIDKPVAPDGYNTQEEADNSILAHDLWILNKSEWDDSPENTGEYPVKEPVILLIPADLPVVVEPPVLIPNEIAQYDHLYGQSLELVQEMKYSDIWAHADDINAIAEATFFLAGLSRERNNDRLKKKHAKIVNKRLSGQVFSDEEIAFNDNYDLLLDYQDSVNDIADLAEDAVEVMTDKYAVDSYDEVNMPSWPVWVMP